MSKYAWCTDIHLDHLDHIDNDSQLVDFVQQLVKTEPSGIFITGDISTVPRLVYHLSAIERVAQRPVFFVLGNHDYYGGEIEPVRKQMKDLCNMSQFLKYLPLSSYVALTQTTALVGHDGWYDAMYGDGAASMFFMNDWTLIKDFVSHSGGDQFVRTMKNVKDRNGLIGLSRKLAHAGVTHMQNGIKAATRYHKHVIVLTHCPPWPHARVNQDKQIDWTAMPWFTSKMCGDMLEAAAKAYPAVKFTVLCGHAHDKWDGQIAPNLECHVGGADYGHPSLAGLIEVP